MILEIIIFLEVKNSAHSRFDSSNGFIPTGTSKKVYPADRLNRPIKMYQVINMKNRLSGKEKLIALLLYAMLFSGCTAKKQDPVISSFLKTSSDGIILIQSMESMDFSSPLHKDDSRFSEGFKPYISEINQNWDELLGNTRAILKEAELQPAEEVSSVLLTASYSFKWNGDDQLAVFPEGYLRVSNHENTSLYQSDSAAAIIEACESAVQKYDSFASQFEKNGIPNVNGILTSIAEGDQENAAGIYLQCRDQAIDLAAEFNEISWCSEYQEVTAYYEKSEAPIGSDPDWHPGRLLMAIPTENLYQKETTLQDLLHFQPVSIETAYSLMNGYLKYTFSDEEEIRNYITRISEIPFYSDGVWLGSGGTPIVYVTFTQGDSYLKLSDGDYLEIVSSEDTEPRTYSFRLNHSSFINQETISFMNDHPEDLIFSPSLNY